MRRAGKSHSPTTLVFNCMTRRGMKITFARCRRFFDGVLMGAAFASNRDRNDACIFSSHVCDYCRPVASRSSFFCFRASTYLRERLQVLSSARKCLIERWKKGRERITRRDALSAASARVNIISIGRG